MAAIYISDALRKRLKLVAAEKGLTMSEFSEWAIARSINGLTKKNGGKKTK